MADKTIGDLNNAPGTVDDSNTLFVVQQSGAAYKLDGHAFILALTTILDGHGGVSSVVYTPPVAPSLTGTMVITLADQSTTTVSIQNGNGITSIAKASTSGLVDTYRITYNDNTTSTFTVTNGAKGDTGQAWYVWIRYAGQQPTSDADIGTSPDDWMGIYSGTASTAPTHYTQYQWFEIKGEKGDTGNTGASIASITKTSGTGEPGTYDTYTVTLDNGDVAGTFTVYNGLNGTGSVATVNNVQPDINGNVAISATNIPTSGGSDVQSDITSLTSLVSTAQATANSKAAINDNTTAAITTWSSNKISNALQDAGGGLYFTNVTCTATTGDFLSLSSPLITGDYVMAECVFDDDTAVLSEATWTTSSGSLIINGVCARATTATIELVKVNN